MFLHDDDTITYLLLVGEPPMAQVVPLWGVSVLVGPYSPVFRHPLVIWFSMVAPGALVFGIPSERLKQSWQISMQGV